MRQNAVERSVGFHYVIRSDALVFEGLLGTTIALSEVSVQPNLQTRTVSNLHYQNYYDLLRDDDFRILPEGSITPIVLSL